MRRVVVTGMAGITALGNNYDSIEENLRANKSGVQYMADWDKYKGLNTRLAGPIDNFEVPDYYTRKQTRSMGRVSKMATVATEQALKQACLLEKPVLSSGQTGIAYGSSTGSTPAMLNFTGLLTGLSTRGITATSYLQMMSHTTAINVGLFFGIRGRVIPTSSACTSGSQAIGYSYESIKNGYQEIMIAGGAEELCASEAAVFDTLFATSTKNESPNKTPAPFDENRDGLVIGEGAGTLILESLDHALERKAKIYAEVVGFGTNCDAKHVTQPEPETMQIAMEIALRDAKLPASAVDYISCHATATDAGDIAESTATSRLFGSEIPVSSLKGHLGHTLGACGALESWFAIEMMNRKWFAPTLNLENIDSRCGHLDYITKTGRELDCEYVMNNNFGFGGLNTSLIFRRWHA